MFENKRTRKSSKLRKIITDIVQKLQKVVNSIRYYIENRFITKSHVLNTGLPPGRWHDLDERILHGLFKEVVDYVEVELAWCTYIMDEDKYAKYKVPWYVFHQFRAPELGIAHLEWQANLKNDEACGYDRTHPEYGKESSHAFEARELLAIYNWIKNVWTLWQPPYIESLYVDAKTAEERQAAIYRMIDLEEAQYAEEQDILIRIIKIRKMLYT